MVVAVGVAVLLARGWRLALLHTVPLAALYIVWFAAIGHSGYTGYHAGIGQILSFVRTFVAATFGAMGHVTGVGLLLGVLLVAGLVLRLPARSAGASSGAGPRCRSGSSPAR